MGRWISGFTVPDNYVLYGSEARIEEGKRIVSTNSSLWLTNLEHGRRHEPLQLMTEAENIRFGRAGVKGLGYQKYDNYDAIEVPYTESIPSDYRGVMGVPITFLGKYNPDQFEILGCSESEGKGSSNGLWDSSSGVAQPVVNEARIYKRIFIRHR